jgi:hypothetical protein
MVGLSATGATTSSFSRINLLNFARYLVNLIAACL